MAYTVDSWPRKPQWQRSLHDWESYFNGEIWVLVEGQDFDSEIESVRSAAYAAAKTQGVKVKCAIRGSKLYVQRR